MSDYLWDKSGEADEEVERLEELLGPLRYQPRPLQLPESFSAQPARSKFRPQRPFKWQRLALAASLLLMLLAGAWLIRWQHSNELRREAAHDHVAPVTHEQPRRDETANTSTNDKPAPQPVVTPAGVLPVDYRRARRASVHHDLSAPRRSSPVPQQASPREVQVANANAPQELTPEQREATEKLLLALRIASAKLNYAERQVQEMSAARKPDIR
ncbi:MAG: hypothetical protein DMF64_10260 [Acidobacteria bacterium]|nr:MAG: hypothetical protein DMF64_10260 [Acidobacteriota bacterium]